MTYRLDSPTLNLHTMFFNRSMSACTVKIVITSTKVLRRCWLRFTCMKVCGQFLVVAVRTAIRASTPKSRKLHLSLLCICLSTRCLYHLRLAYLNVLPRVCLPCSRSLCVSPDPLNPRYSIHPSQRSIRFKEIIFRFHWCSRLLTNIGNVRIKLFYSLKL